MDLDRSFSSGSRGSPRIKWSAVLAGWAVGFALHIVLTLAGLGFGAWAVDLHNANPTEGIPVGAGIWTGFSVLASAFVGGYVTAMVSGSAERRDGVYHGLAVWGVTWLVFAWLTTTAMSTMIGGAFSLFGTTLRTVAQGFPPTTSAAGVRDTGTRVTLSVDDLRREIDSVIRARDTLESQPERARQTRTLGPITDQSLSELRDNLSALDREAAVQLMVNRYGMSDAEARDVVQSTIGLLGSVQEPARGAKQRPTLMGAEAFDHLGMIALWLSGLGLISLAVSAIGGMIGIREEALVDTALRTESYRDIRRAS
jgi:hypothetical protein